MSQFIYYIESEDRFSKTESKEISEDKPIDVVLALNIVLDRIKEIELQLTIMEEGS